MKKKSKLVHRGARAGTDTITGNTGQFHGNTGVTGKPKTGHAARRNCGRKGTDVFSPAKRSAVMAVIRGRGNKGTELRLISIMRAGGVAGWRRGVTLTGRPDFVFPRERLAVFVDGCFWHGCPKHATWPKQNAEFWRTKILRNRARDRRVNRLLKQAGWHVLRIWEHDLGKRHETRTVRRILAALQR